MRHISYGTTVIAFSTVLGCNIWQELELEPKLWTKVEPEPKVNNFGSTPLLKPLGKATNSTS